MNRMTRLRPEQLPLLLAAVIGVAIASSSRADIVATEGQRPRVAVDIIDLREGELHYRLNNGREMTRPIHEVSYLQITDWSLFNLAEKQQRDGHLHRAVGNYERVLSRLELRSRLGVQEVDVKALTRDQETESAALPASPVDRALLVRCRLVPAYDRLGRFDRAVAVYLDVLAVMPEVLETLRPSQIAAGDSTFMASARSDVEAAVQRYGDDPIAKSLAQWRASWPEPGNASDSFDDASRRKPTRRSLQQAHRKVDVIAKLVDSGRFEDALKAIEPLQIPSSGTALPDLYYWEGRARFARAGAQGDAAAEDERMRAGLAWMRVVIHFPRHERAPECLYRAGELCAGEGRKETAVRLWTELVETYPDASPWVGQARDALQAPAEPKSDKGQNRS